MKLVVNFFFFFISQPNFFIFLLYLFVDYLRNVTQRDY